MNAATGLGISCFSQDGIIYMYFQPASPVIRMQHCYITWVLVYGGGQPPIHIYQLAIVHGRSPSFRPPSFQSWGSMNKQILFSSLYRQTQAKCGQKLDM